MKGLAVLADSPRGFGQRFGLDIDLMGTSKQTRLLGVKGLVWKVGEVRREGKWR